MIATQAAQSILGIAEEVNWLKEAFSDPALHDKRTQDVFCRLLVLIQGLQTEVSRLAWAVAHPEEVKIAQMMPFAGVDKIPKGKAYRSG